VTSIYEIVDLAAVLTFAAWTLVVCAIAKFLFGSYPAAELLYRLARRDRLRQQRVAQLSATLPAHPGDGTADQQADLDRLHIAPAWQRALSYFFTCFACQTFWSAVVVFALTRDTSDWRTWFFSAAAYSAAATLLAKASHGRSVAQQRGGCGSCGGR